MKPIIILRSLIALFCLFAFSVNTFASLKPISSIGIVVKKNPGGSAERTITTDEDGSFTLELEAGEYTLLVPQDELHAAITQILKSSYPNSRYRFDGSSGVQLNVQTKKVGTPDNRRNSGENYELDQSTSSITIEIQEDGVTVLGVLRWADDGITSMGSSKSSATCSVKLVSTPTGCDILFDNQNPHLEETRNSRIGFSVWLEDNNLMALDNESFDETGRNSANGRSAINSDNSKFSGLEAMFTVGRRSQQLSVEDGTIIIPADWNGEGTLKLSWKWVTPGFDSKKDQCAVAFDCTIVDGAFNAVNHKWTE